MQVSSASIALTILRGSQAPAALSHAPVNASVPEFQPTLIGEEDIELTAKMKMFAEAGTPPDLVQMLVRDHERQLVRADLANGKLSPFGSEIAKEYEGISTRKGHGNMNDPRKEFGGHFSMSQIENYVGRPAEVTQDTAFLDRRDAIATAYHFASDFAQGMLEVSQGVRKARRDEKGNIYGLSSSGEILEDRNNGNVRTEHGTDSLIRRMEQMEGDGAGLARHFSFDRTAVTRAALKGEVSAFSITHGTFGKLMDVGKDGTVTLYDAQGTAFSMQDYNSANSSERIPEVHNDLIDLADREAARAEYEKHRAEDLSARAAQSAGA